MVILFGLLSATALKMPVVPIAYLELTYDEETVIAIDGLTLPIIGKSDGPKTYSARRVSIEIPENGTGSTKGNFSLNARTTARSACASGSFERGSGK